MNTLLPNAVIYCRVSGFKQIEGSSLKTQEAICTDFVLKRGHQVIEKFIEKGESAKTADRTELQRMLKYCIDKRNKVSMVVFYKVDRLARYRYDYEWVCHVLRSKGIEIQSATEPLTNTPAGRFMEGMLAAQAQFDNEVRAERSTDGMKDAVRAGRYIWAAPIGYKNVREGGKATIAPSELAPVVLETFQRIARGIEPIDEIRKQMFHRGLMSTRGKPLAKAYFYRLLRNPIYAGYIKAFKIMQKGRFEAVVPEDVFNQVQLVLKCKGRKMLQYKRDHEDFPLRRFLRHPNGHRIRGYWSRGKLGKRYPYYRYEGLAGANYRRDGVEAKFVRLLNSYALSPADARECTRLVGETYTQATKERRKTEETLKKRLQEIHDRENLLVEKNLKGIIPDDVVQKQISLLKNEQLEIGAQLYADSTADISIRKVLEHARKFLENPGFFWKNADLQAKTELQGFAFPQGVTFDGKKLRTPEVALFFKTKEAFSASQSPIVRNRFQFASSLMVQFDHLTKILTRERTSNH